MLKRFLILLLMTIVATCNIMAQADTRQATSVQVKHNPKRATLYSAVLPGLGQAYNKKYWKIPIVYAGIGAIYYVADMNGDYYRDFRDAYDYQSGINTDVSEEAIDYAGKYSANNLITLRDSYRRNMELSWIIMALWYGINIIDATVDAHFFEYDISDDLTLKVEPMIKTNFGETAYLYGYGKCSTGVSLKLKF